MFHTDNFNSDYFHHKRRFVRFIQQYYELLERADQFKIPFNRRCKDFSVNVVTEMQACVIAR